jgi:hypothetical protein
VLHQNAAHHGNRTAGSGRILEAFAAAPPLIVNEAVHHLYIATHHSQQWPAPQCGIATYAWLATAILAELV